MVHFLNSLYSLSAFCGVQVRLILVRFLPGVFMDAMRDSAEAAVHIFEGTHENPELIWNDTSRETVSTTVREMMLEWVAPSLTFIFSTCTHTHSVLHKIS